MCIYIYTFLLVLDLFNIPCEMGINHFDLWPQVTIRD